MVNGDGQWKQRWSDQTSLSGHISAHAIRTGGPTIFDLPAFENPSRHFVSSFLHCVSDPHPNRFFCILCNRRPCSLPWIALFSNRASIFVEQQICLACSLNIFCFCSEFCPIFSLLFYMVGSRDIIMPIISSIWLKDRHINFCTQRHGSLQSWPVAESTTKFWDCFGGDTIFALYIWNILLLRCLVARLLMVTGDGG